MQPLMREQLGIAREWLVEGRPFVSATVVAADGSSPFQSGAFMLVDRNGGVEGSITGGCVEADVARQAAEMLDAGEHTRMTSYGVADELAQTAGLACGGTVHVFLQAPRREEGELLATAYDAAIQGSPVAVATILDGPRAGSVMTIVSDEAAGSLHGGQLLDHNVEADLRGMLLRAGSSLRRYGDDGAVAGDALRVHLRSHLPAVQLIIVGALDFSAAIATLAGQLGFRTSIVDARPAFVASRRFHRCAEVHVGWPQDVIPRFALTPRDIVLVLSHDPRFDEPAVRAALDTGCGYIGALGSRRTAADRVRRLRELGVAEEQLGRVHSPCGLDIGAASPEEVAVSVLAEAIACLNGRDGGPLRAASGPIRGHE